MIKRPNNWNEVKEFSDRPKLPVGAYVCRVKNAVIQSTDYGEQLCLDFDIEDGEFAGYYAEDFKANTREDKKWKGVLRQFIPKDDGSERDEWTKSAFKGMITAFENSNRGYVWNWNEDTLKHKLVGIIFRNEEWEYQGKTGWAVRPFRACSVDTVNEGTFNLPKDKPLKNKPTTSSYPSYDSASYSAPQMAGFSEVDDDEELPF